MEAREERKSNDLFHHTQNHIIFFALRQTVKWREEKWMLRQKDQLSGVENVGRWLCGKSQTTTRPRVRELKFHRVQKRTHRM